MTAVAELFHPDLNPTLRRLGERPRGAGRAGPSEEDRQVRESVWATLAELDGLRGPGLLDTAELMGPGLYQSPFLDTVFAAELLAADGRFGAELDRIAAGELTLAVAMREHGTDEPDQPAALTVARDRVTGVRRFVAFAAEVDHLLVVGGQEPVLALVPVRQRGVRTRRQDDLGRGDLYEVVLTGARARLLTSGGHYATALANARLRLAAHLAGIARGAVELSAAHLKDRRAFGAPLARQQVLAHRLAALAARTTAVLTFARTAARAAGTGADVRLPAAQALFLAADLAREAAAEAVHLHGARGLTEECDASVFHRRAAVTALTLGTPAGLRRLAATLLANAHTV
ncbi:acyl-CoA dehydrogenase family protein [Goodfellowiella coeruleoviolacea]|uniref:Acyl-CoA dehydrogenase n=1 Tax=Goodfellowiella coeruleoviolacea TaxID=334858 RepID=A0AAE3GGE1_9PSEU|nr:acyl-CoA dehydrogenase family protein [Goodfellowiella coeruleoviolacea]MCP2166902.1 Acyl-CoA dehydrogenase [Goodfellowiella coeruleoviolacea]